MTEIPALSTIVRNQEKYGHIKIVEILANEPTIKPEHIKLLSSYLKLSYSELENRQKHYMMSVYNRSIDSVYTKSDGMLVCFKNHNVKGFKVRIAVLSLNEKNGLRKLESKRVALKSLL